MFNSSLQVGARSVDPGGDEQEGDDCAGQVGGGAQAIHGVDEDVDAFVAVLIATTDGDEESAVRVERLAVEQFGRAEQLTSGVGASGGIAVGCGDEVGLEAVRSHYVRRLVEQLATLYGGDLAHRREAVSEVSCLFLYGVLRFDV